MSLSNEELERYSRHIILKGIGYTGQKKLSQAKVLIAGVGGLGSPAAMYLAAAGVGTIGIADADVVDLSNLQRQIIHTTKDIGTPKVDSAAETMRAINPNIEVKTYKEYLRSSNIREIIRGYDFVLDGTDNISTKYLINDACVMEKIPFSIAGILQFYGQLMTVIPGETPCYRCIFKRPPAEGTVVTCRDAGVIGAIAGVIGCLQSLEAVKYITGAGKLLAGKLLTFDALTMDFETVDLSSRDEDCAVCGEHPTITELSDSEQCACGLSTPDTAHN